MSVSTKASDIANSAVQVGSVSKAAGPAAAAAVQAAAGTSTGVDVAKLESGRAFLVNVEVDDSQSMQGFEPQVVMALNRLLDELSEAAQESDADILVQIVQLNKGVFQPYCKVEECQRLTDSSYKPDGGTPLYACTQSTLGAMVRKIAELQQSGRTGQSFTAIISDGNPTDAGAGRESGPEAVDLPAQVRQLIAGLTQTKQHIVCGVSIGAAADDFFTSVGINRKWILDPARDGFAFEQAIRQVSRVSKSASKGAGAFAQAANEGFN